MKGKQVKPMQSMVNHPFQIDKNYLIRTVTMIQIGKLTHVFDHELVLEDASWIADTGRFSETLMKGEDHLNEVEPFPNGPVIVGRGAIIDMCIWNFALPREMK